MQKPIAEMTLEERQRIDMCKCGCSRFEHETFGGRCKNCEFGKCSRFKWSHNATPEE